MTTYSTSRLECVICSSKLEDIIYSEEVYPINICYSESSKESDIFLPLKYYGCGTCECVQLGTLINPEILYGSAHNVTFNTPTWVEHHTQFANFINKFCNKNDIIIEVGGYSGVLAKLLYNIGFTNYSILDLCNISPDISGILFINTNCETYSYINTDTVILSHIFEHLFNPSLFIKNLYKSTVSNIYISIPNMALWLEQNVPSFLHVEHTYYCTKDNINYLMNMYGFKLQNEQIFKSHSLFLHYIRKNSFTYNNIPINTFKGTIDKFRVYFSRRNAFFNTVYVDTPFFIFPAGHYGQLTYLKLLRFNHLFISFLDNDPCKIGKRVYGTSGITQHPSILEKYLDKEISIIIISTVYINEIQEQLNKIHPNINYITYDV